MASPESKRFPVKELFIGRNFGIAAAVVAAASGALGVAMLSGIVAGGAHITGKQIEKSRR